MIILKQNELYNLGNNGVKVPIDGYKFGKDGIIVPDNNNSYTIGKDGDIIPKAGYTVGKGGIIIKKPGTSFAASFFKSDKISSSDIPITSSYKADLSYSNLVLMVGGQILLIVLLLMIVFFGVAPLSFPVDAVRNMISRNSINNS